MGTEKINDYIETTSVNVLLDFIKEHRSKNLRYIKLRYAGHRDNVVIAYPVGISIKDILGERYSPTLVVSTDKDAAIEFLRENKYENKINVSTEKEVLTFPYTTTTQISYKIAINKSYVIGHDGWIIKKDGEYYFCSDDVIKYSDTGFNVKYKVKALDNVIIMNDIVHINFSLDKETQDGCPQDSCQEKENKKEEKKEVSVTGSVNFGSFPGFCLISINTPFKTVVEDLKNEIETEGVDDAWLEGLEGIGEEKFNEACAAYHRVAKGKDLYYINFNRPFKFTDYDYAVLAHECLHICQYHLPDFLDRNVELEAEAYTHTHLMMQILKIIRGDDKESIINKH